MVRKEILFASNNAHKVEEVRKLLPENFHLLSLSDLGWTEDIPEPFDTYQENATAKVQYVFERTGLSCFSDDSGLAIDALDGRPGVFSARYAGDKGNAKANIDKVLHEMNGLTNRSGRFYSVIAFMDPIQHVTLFQGIVEGVITIKPNGTGGFGYDPIFIPTGFHQTFGQLPDALKNRISHRAAAMKKFLSFLIQQA